MNFLIVFCLIFSPIHGLNLTPIVNLTSGPIQGKVTEYESIGVYQFLGIPYAKPPVDKLRFQLPVEPDPWTEVEPATAPGPACLQPPVLPNIKETSEDCLYLNIFVTESTFNNSSNKQRPVLFWIHGGGFTTGSGVIDGLPIVSLHDVVLVSINYRLNAFGFMNIQKFGGDPNSVTIFGASAGSVSVSAHLLSPLSKGLFKRAILESGTIYQNHNDDTLVLDSWKLYNKTSCSKSKDVLECMQNLSATEILNNISDKVLAYSFKVGDDFLPYEPSKAFAEGFFDNSIDILLGVVKNDGSVFMKAIDPIVFDYSKVPQPISYQQATTYLKRIFNSESVDYFRELYFGPETNDSDFRSQLEIAYSDATFICPTYVFGLQYASSLGSQGGKVYAYYHTQKPKTDHMPEWIGTYHGADVSYVFGTNLQNPGNSHKDASLSREMMKIWTYFAENGETPMIGETRWKTMQESKSAMILNIDDWGKTETERIEFCHKEWPYMSKNVIIGLGPFPNIQFLIEHS
ncbi:LOW QUALITY PROTEIN: acetylcholinesterase-like [Tetranychus urticae]|uniref:LOW QUALITY PROTEIN: acetylcholinesterase-like n=1 Tax=Tetranychus urticae TaxID=32264 RepID=UPI000D6464C3|nr:LOW QUALITY PROTEIN: acetylcholinesterase-like [Tetranychus urticae]